MNVRSDKTIDTANFLVIVVTFVFFALALVTKGVTHDLFLEAGVFLVSVKLIIASHQIRVKLREIDRKLDNKE